MLVGNNEFSTSSNWSTFEGTLLFTGQGSRYELASSIISCNSTSYMIVE